MTNREAVEAIMKSFGLWEEEGSTLFLHMISHIMDEKDTRLDEVKDQLAAILDTLSIDAIPAAMMHQAYEALNA
jgi:hypothetical protein